MEFIHNNIGLSDIPQLLQSKVQLSDESKAAVLKNRAFLDKKVAEGNVYYGINTGFGSLCNVQISNDQLTQLQHNLVRSHSVGCGAIVPVEIVKIMMLLKIIGLSKGYSGIHIDTLERLIYFYNNDILPVVYEQGSLGASGDLAPLAHLSLPLIGDGKVFFKGVIRNTKEVLELVGLQPLNLHAKEGLALLNGTQFMNSFGVWAALKSQALNEWADIIATLSLEAFNGKKEPFLPFIHNIRPHQGQKETAAYILNLLDDSQIQAQHKPQVQDPYSFRCIPQVHGATKDALRNAANVFNIEIESVTDNPIVFDEEDLIVSGGNFHGQPLALQLDFLGIAMAEIANISERRTYLLISGQRNLPAFLVNEPGLNSGYMIAQYTAASIVSQNKQLATPASVDSIVSSNGQEDHVSMGANAATKLKRIIDNVQRVLAIELMCATQAIDFGQPNLLTRPLFNLYTMFRRDVTFNDADRILHDDIVIAERFLNQSPRIIFE